MKRKIIALAAITLIALIPVAILSIDEASASRKAPQLASSAALSTSSKAKAKSKASEKPAEKKKLTATQPASRTASKSKTSPSRTSQSKSHSSQSSSKKPSGKTATPSKEQRLAKEKTADLTTTQKSKMLALLNEGDTQQLASIKGISTTRATAIEKARPFSSIEEVVLVRGIGETTFSQVIAHARSLTARRSSSKSTKSKTGKS